MKKRKIVVSLLLAFGLFTNLTNDNINKETTNSFISIQQDETIDGKH